MMREDEREQVLRLVPPGYTLVDSGRHARVARAQDLVLGVLDGQISVGLHESAQPKDYPPPYCFVNRLDVHLDYRRAGVGSALVRAFAAEAQEAGCTHLALTAGITGDG